MRIQVNFSALGRSRWYEYLVRFAFGGVVTALAGLIAKRYGPVTGGLFLAFPAIFPATATLLEKHERKQAGDSVQVTRRARVLAGIDAAGAGMGSIGLAAFGMVIWLGLRDHDAGWVLTIACLAWTAGAVGSWWCRKALVPRFRSWTTSLTRRT